MKKAYTKPQLFVEDFALTQTVAQHCGTIKDSTSSLGHPTHKEKNVCGWWLDDDTIVWVLGSTCNLTMDENEPFDGICYNNPEGGVSIFAS